MCRNRIDNYLLARSRMMNRLKTDSGITSGSVLEVMSYIPRHFFISEALRYRAYEDISLPIGFKQTISKPSTIARMVQALELTGCERVLEIGTGSGYQSAVIANLVNSLITSERITELYQRARDKLLINLKYKNVKLMNCSDFHKIDGPFDSIIVAAAADLLPADLLDKLDEGGKLLIPVGNNGKHIIKRYIKKGGYVVEEDICEASFVPLILN